SLADSPESATYRGIHTYDKKLTDYSPAAVKKRLAWRHAWRDRFAAVDKKALSRDEAADLEAMRLDNESSLVSYQSVREWQRRPRVYSSAGINGVYLVVKRNFASLPERMALAIAREETVPAVLAAGKQNLKDAPKISVEMALEELPANIDFLKNDTV